MEIVARGIFPIRHPPAPAEGLELVAAGPSARLRGDGDGGRSGADHVTVGGLSAGRREHCKGEDADRSQDPERVLHEVSFRLRH